MNGEEYTQSERKGMTPGEYEKLCNEWDSICKELRESRYNLKKIIIVRKD